MFYSIAVDGQEAGEDIWSSGSDTHCHCCFVGLFFFSEVADRRLVLMEIG